MKRLLLTLSVFFVTIFYSLGTGIPPLNWAHALSDTNGASYCYPGPIIAAPDGSVYITSIMNPGTYDFDPSENDSMITITKGRSAVISKYNVDGEFLWARLYETTGDFWTKDIKLDSAGNVYFIGSIAGEIDLDHTASEDLYDTKSWNSSGIVIKLTANGDPVWTKLFDAIGNDDISPSQIVINDNQEVYVSGVFRGTQDFDSLGTGGVLTAFGDFDIFLMKMDASGDFQWVKQLGGSSGESNIGMGQTPEGDLILVNSVQGAGDYDPSTNDSVLTSSNNTFTTIAKYSDAGDFIWGRVLESTTQVYPQKFTMDKSGSFYISGYVYGTADYDLDSGSYTLQYVGGETFLVKYDKNGGFEWVNQYGVNAGININSMSVEPNGSSLYISGEFTGNSDFDPTINALQLFNNDGYTFVSKFDTSGTFETAYSLQLNLGGEEIVMLSAGYRDDLYYTGEFNSIVDVDPTSVVDELTTDATGGTLFIQRLGEADNATAINDLMTFNHAIYPNPTTGKVIITIPKGSGQSEVVVLDLFGNQVSKSTYSSSDSIEVTLDGPVGIYIINVIIEDNTSSYKVIKE
ncbi:MAG: T9SS type A sorting domain-containing protein [Flavobacteriales bacterium]|nr:T9SS type A sorting domain-containing protein [Flavobacteriales bacterium]